MARPVVDISGRLFGEWIVLFMGGKVPSSNVQKWVCECSCGTRSEVAGTQLRSGMSRSCGCKRKAFHTATKKEHYPLRDTPEYVAWSNIKDRCLNPRCSMYKHYGGRGVTICDEWRDNFDAFIAHLGRRPSSEHSVDRIDNNRSYEPGNVRWATHVEQHNNKRNNVWLLDALNNRHTIAQWARLIGVTPNTVRKRIGTHFKRE